MTAATRAELEALDRADPLAWLRDAFLMPDGVVYLDGNSLGPLPAETPARVEAVMRREWGEGLIRSWNDAGWIGLAGQVGDKIAQLVGAAPGTVMVAGDSVGMPSQHRQAHGGVKPAEFTPGALSPSQNMLTRRGGVRAGGKLSSYASPDSRAGCGTSKHSLQRSSAWRRRTACARSGCAAGRP